LVVWIFFLIAPHGMQKLWFTVNTMPINHINFNTFFTSLLRKHEWWAILVSLWCLRKESPLPIGWEFVREHTFLACKISFMGLNIAAEWLALCFVFRRSWVQILAQRVAFLSPSRQVPV
jgi:hypothetical protein